MDWMGKAKNDAEVLGAVSWATRMIVAEAATVPMMNAAMERLPIRGGRQVARTEKSLKRLIKAGKVRKYIADGEEWYTLKTGVVE